jgi:hypothetical protein
LLDNDCGSGLSEESLSFRSLRSRVIGKTESARVELTDGFAVTGFCKSLLLVLRELVASIRLPKSDALRPEVRIEREDLSVALLESVVWVLLDVLTGGVGLDFLNEKERDMELLSEGVKVPFTLFNASLAIWLASA